MSISSILSEEEKSTLFSAMENMEKRENTEEFTRKDFLELAKKVGVCKKTADKYLGKFMAKHHFIVRISQGKYKRLGVSVGAKQSNVPLC